MANANATPSERALELERRNLRQLERLFHRGVTPRLDALAGWEYRGINTPGWHRLLPIKKFLKGFYWQAGQVRGYNCMVRQNGLSNPWLALPHEQAPKRGGFYTVAPVDPASRDNKYPHAVLLDYGKAGNPIYDPRRGLRDYLVQVDDDDDTLYLGKAYYALGVARLPTFSFFVLERHRAS